MPRIHSNQWLLACHSYDTLYLDQEMANVLEIRTLLSGFEGFACVFFPLSPPSPQEGGCRKIGISYLSNAGKQERGGGERTS